MHLTTIDSEFNNKYQPLSIGIVKSKLFNINYIHESFYKASVDFWSYRIHGLSESFLRKFGKEQFESRKLVNALGDTVLVGFSIENDIRAIKIPRHYKLIDLHDIFKSFDLGILLGLGYRIAPKLDLDARFNVGASNVSDFGEGIKMRNNYWQVGLNYWFK